MHPKADISGTIAGETYVVAWTCGDGACGLHAVLGAPEVAGGMLRCDGVRERVVGNVPDSVQDVLALYGGALREPFA